MSFEPAECRLCGNPHIKCLGAIPDSDYFAGQVQPQTIDGGHLWRCDSCESMFRHPVLKSSEYLNMYARGAADEWMADNDREDLAVIRGMIAQQATGARVFDIGCGAGDFLLTLPAEMMKYGVEPSLAAAAAAAKGGVSILAPTLAEMSPSARFDVITMIDVIEHVDDPGGLLDMAATHLAPGGTLLIATGDPGNIWWKRVFQSRFWYSSFAEHITFPSLKYFEIWRRTKGFEAPTMVRLRYRRLKTLHAAIYFVSQVTYRVSPGLMSWLGRMFEWIRCTPRPRRRFFSPGAPGLFTDHQIVSLRRTTGHVVESPGP